MQLSHDVIKLLPEFVDLIKKITKLINRNNTSEKLILIICGMSVIILYVYL